MEHKKNFVAGIFFILLSIVYLVIISSTEAQIQATSVAGGGKMMPCIVGVGMIICGSILSVSSYRQWKLYEKTKAQAGSACAEKANIKEDDDKKCVAAVLLVFAAYVGLLSHLGFLVSTILFLWIEMFLLDKNPKKQYLQYTIVSLIAGIVIQVIFVKLFQLALPAGTLFAGWR